MSLYSPDNNQHDMNISGTNVVRSANGLPTLRPELKQQVLQACVQARRKRKADRITAGKTIMTTALIMFGLLGYDAFGAMTSPQTSTEITLVAEVKYQQTFVDCSLSPASLLSMGEIGTMEHVDHLIALHHHQKNMLKDFLSASNSTPTGLVRSS